MSWLLAVGALLYLYAMWHDRRVKQDEQWEMFNPRHRRKPGD